MTTPSRRRLLAVLPALALLGLAGCTPDKPQPSTSSGGAPSPAQIEDLRKRLAAIPQVTDVELHFSPGHTLVDGPFWKGKLTTSAADKAELMHILDEAYRTVWLDADVPFGQLGFAVVDGTGTGVGTRDWPDGPVTPADMQKRYGARPSS